MVSRKGPQSDAQVLDLAKLRGAHASSITGQGKIYIQPVISIHNMKYDPIQVLKSAYIYTVDFIKSKIPSSELETLIEQTVPIRRMDSETKARLALTRNLLVYNTGLRIASLERCNGPTRHYRD